MPGLEEDQDETEVSVDQPVVSDLNDEHCNTMCDHDAEIPVRKTTKSRSRTKTGEKLNLN